LTISAIILTRNTASTIRRCLDSISDVVDEIIVVDGYSSDDTVRICQEYTDLIFSREPKGFVEPDRNYALSKATSDWILYIDADEWLSKSLHDSIRELIAKTGVDAFSFSRVNFFMSRPILHGLSYPDTQVRLYKKAKAHYAGLIHEQPIILGRVFNSRLHILHEQKDSNRFLSERIVRYVIFWARQHHREESRLYYLMRAPMMSARILVFYYFKKGGYLDGYQGLAMHMKAALEFFIRTLFMAFFARSQTE